MGCAPSPNTNEYVHPDDARMAAFWRVYNNHLVIEDLYPAVARRFASAGVQRFAEIGGGRGPVAQALDGSGVAAFVIDRDSTMVTEAHRPVARGDLRQLPLATGSVDGVAAINCLYFLDDPLQGLQEVHRVLSPGGLFLASSPSRWNDPELEGIDQSWGTASTFDSEDAPDLVAQVFGDVTVEPWRVVAYVLPDQVAIADYLHAFNVHDWEAKAAKIEPPLSITKVGAEVWARR